MAAKNESGWRAEARRLLHGTSHDVEKVLDRGKRRLRKKLGKDEPAQIVAYRGFGTREKVTLSGRVLQDKPTGGPQDDDKWWQNVLAMYRRWESDELEGVTLEGRFAGDVQRAVSDEEGYFHFTFEPTEPLDEKRLWHDVALRVVSVPSDVEAVGGIEALGSVVIPPETATFGIISDLDDTVIQTHATNMLAAAKITFLNNAKTRLPFEGVAAFYQALHHGPNGPARSDRNPLFYVSSSAWNLYDLLADFLDLQEVPAGPILLRDLGLDENMFIKTGHEHKLEKVRRILSVYPKLPFVLIGDSGQEDAELYLEAIGEHGPDRIRAIFIRNVSDELRGEEVRKIGQRATELGVPMWLVDDSYQAAKKAAELGLIAPIELPDVKQDRDRDAAGSDAAANADA